MFAALGTAYNSFWGAAPNAEADTDAAPLQSTPAPEICSEREAYWYLNLDEQQKQAVVDLRALLEAAGCLVAGIDDDYALLRFLKAREFDVEKASAMYQEMAKWRQENQVDTIMDRESFPETDALLESYPQFYHKTDKFGRPVYIELLGKADSGKVLNLVTVERLLEFHTYQWERYWRVLLPACSEAAGKKIMTTCVIVDLAGLSLQNFNMSTQKIMNAYSKIDQDYFPEHLGLLFVINAPLIFRGIWAAVQPLLQERTRRKIIILGSDYLPSLKQVIDEENIPTIFGGKSEIPDVKVSVGPWQAYEAAHGHAMPRPVSVTKSGSGSGNGSEQASPTTGASGRGRMGEASMPEIPAAAEGDLAAAKLADMDADE